MSRDHHAAYLRRDRAKLAAHWAESRARRDERARAAGYRNYQHQRRARLAAETGTGADNAPVHGIPRGSIAARLAEMEASGMFDDLEDQ